MGSLYDDKDDDEIARNWYPQSKPGEKKHAIPHGNLQAANRQALAQLSHPQADNLGLTSKLHLTLLIERYTT